MPRPIARRDFLATSLGAMAAMAAPGAARPEERPAAAAKPRAVRDRLWVWAHHEGVYNGQWGLKGTSRITPVEGARHLGVDNVILVRYEGKPAPPFDDYAAPFKSMKRVMWSVTGAGGTTSDAERGEVLKLAARMPNMVGLFMDDFFHFGGDERPQWLAQNRPAFPVTLTVSFAQPIAPTRLELTQTAWPTGDYRTNEFAVDLSPDGRQWREAARGALPNTAGAAKTVALAGAKAAALRVRILSTHDLKDAMSCGLGRLRLWEGDREVGLGQATATATSTYPGHEPANLVADADAVPARAALTVEQLRELRPKLALPNRRLDLGVTLYATQLSPRIAAHLESIDVVSLWTWKPADLDRLEDNFARLRRLAPGKRILLGCYMWDFDAGSPMPLDRMKRQCELGLKWLKSGEAEGMILLATNLCDLGLETVAWTRRWVQEVGDQPLQ